MKNIFLLILLIYSMGLAKTPMQLLKDGECYWPKLGDEPLVKGCPIYWTKKSKGCSAKFTTKKIDGEDVLQVNWNAVEFTKDGKIKYNGKVKFVVDVLKSGKEGLFPYEVTVSCKGPTCKNLESLIISQLQLIARVFEIYDFSGAFGLWNRTFSIDMEEALYYTNHEIVKETFQKHLIEGAIRRSNTVSFDAMEPILFIYMMQVSRMECP